MSRRNHQPYWFKQLLDQANTLFTKHYLAPQLDGCGEDFRAVFARHVDLSGPNIHVGDHVHLTALADKPIRLAVFEGLGRIEVGSYSIINPGVRVTSASQVTIGEGCMLAMNCYLSDADWHDIEHRIFAPGKTSAITLKDNVWIGDSAIVTKGVTIGHNSVVGAYSVVTRDVADNTIVAGNPAKVVGSIDPSHLTTRKNLFTMEQPYEEFEQQYYADMLKGNSLVDWIRSIVWPNNRD